MRKLVFCICENKGADQLRSYHAADLHLCFCCIDIETPLLPKFEISNLWPSLGAVYSPVCVGPGRYTEDKFSHDTAQLSGNTHLTFCPGGLHCNQYFQCCKPFCCVVTVLYVDR